MIDMTAVANDPRTADSPGCDWKMTVFELAIFMCVFRAGRAPGLEEICHVIGEWFECAVDPTSAAAPIEHMLANRWVAEESHCFRATEEGRSAARPLMNGIIRMLDQGTRLIDVALMMSVLRLSKGELDHGLRIL
ncbi:hypothetical protein FHR20_004212 [Sphingomonas leidyi]|uniref:Uncharacterized protein n=2 Tax=Sphingomonadaceae TaxID=41297 RepID=A0A7X5ZXG5_9SPHN|nr:hypothetical protein [Sphingomonas leidyi]